LDSNHIWVMSLTFHDVIDHVAIEFPIGHFLLVLVRFGGPLQPSLYFKQFLRYSMANVTQWSNGQLSKYSVR